MYSNKFGDDKLIGIDIRELQDNLMCLKPRTTGKMR